MEPNNNAHDPNVGRKDDSDKLDLTFNSEYFPRALMAVAQVSTFGAKKYARGNWKRVEDGIERYRAAAERHHLAHAIAADSAAYSFYDSESNILHKAHEAWNVLAELELILRQKEALSGDCKTSKLALSDCN